MGDDAEENRRAILARRARFITAAIAGLSLTAGCPRDPEPRPCLDAPPPGTGGGDVGGGNGDGGHGGVGGEGGIGGRGEGGGET